MSFLDTARHYIEHVGLHFRRAKLGRRPSGFSNFDEERMLGRFIKELFPPGHSRTAVDIGAGDGVKGENTYALFRRGAGLGVEVERGARAVSRGLQKSKGVRPCARR